MAVLVLVLQAPPVFVVVEGGGVVPPVGEAAAGVEPPSAGVEAVQDLVGHHEGQRAPPEVGGQVLLLVERAEHQAERYHWGM